MRRSHRDSAYPACPSIPCVVPGIYVCFNLLTTNEFIAPGSSFQGQTIQPTNFILPPQEKAFPPAMQSHPPPPLWSSCSPVAEAHLPPPPWPSHSPVAGKANPATPETLAPLISTLKKGLSGTASQATLATLTPLIWILKMGHLRKQVKHGWQSQQQFFGVLLRDR